MRLRYFLVFSVLLFHFSQSNAQDTLFRYYPEFTKYYLIDHPDTATGIDTSIMLFNRFHPAEIPFAYLHFGYLGAPASPMYLTPIINPDIDIGFHQFDAYWRSIDKVKLYDTREPYTSFAYQQGGNKEIRVNIIHTQNITPNLSLGVDFNRLVTDGAYLRQQTKISNFDAFLRYTSPNKFYRGTLIYVLNQVKSEQNGGVTNDSIFEGQNSFNAGLEPVNLNYASTRWKNDEIVMTNAIHFGKKIYTNKKDSLDKGTIIPKLRLQQRFEWEKRSYSFDDDIGDSAAYSNPEIFPAEGIHDSLVNNRLLNEFRVTKFREDSSIHKVNFTADAFFRHTLYNVQNNFREETFTGGIIGASFLTTFISKIFLSAEGQLNLLSRNQGDFLLRAKATYQFAKGRDFLAEGVIASTHPPLIADQFYSTYFNWNNNFSPNTTSYLSGSYVDEKWKFSLKVIGLTQSHLVYWDNDGTPQQSGGTMNVLQIYLMKNFTLWRFHLDNELGYETYSRDSIVAYPSFILRTGLYYFDNVFNGALQVKTGFDINYRDKYYIPAYAPETGQFLIQRDQQFTYYPVVDVYVTIKIRAVRLFAMFQNVNQDLGYKGNFSGYLYPMPDRAFKFGFQWLFWN